MRRTGFTDDHDDFRRLVRDYLAREVVPVFDDWLAARRVPRELFLGLGKLGVIGLPLPLEYGGGGRPDFTFNAILSEEAARAGVAFDSLRVHMDVVVPYFAHYADAAQRARWLPGLAAGELITAIAMTEPGTGSDLAGITTTAVRDGDHWVLNGAKTFISNGTLADLVIVVARTSREDTDRRRGLSLLVVEDGMPGFVKGRELDKIGLHAQDTVELSFTDVRVPAANLLGDEGRAFTYLGANLPQERLTIAIGSVAAARAAHDSAIAYVRDRRVFGQPLSGFQNTKFELAAVATEVEAGQALVDRALAEHVAGELSPADAAMVKLFCTELQGRAVDRCLQLFGGYGYMTEYPIARLYADARVSRIYGGTSEVMKTIISRSMGL
ncbi:MAG TPA: acyl-CoA dehydrogenase family protein [Pseudonocardia sp.]|nr:acyl-CoA dehydrogenase family protein [Pseudonocardia sp.]